MGTTPPKSTGSINFWRPLRLPIFRALLLANLVSDIGTFMQNVGAAWLMVSFNIGPAYVALTQTASTLPFFLLAPLAGSYGDLVVRRKLVLLTEAWMMLCAFAIFFLTVAGKMSPWLLLGLTFALSAGDAFEAPSWRAIMPELVGRDDLTAASVLNGIEFNFARAIGPALAGLVIAVAGVSLAFAVNVVSFIGVLVVIARWRSMQSKHSAPLESLPGAVVAGFRYIRNSPQIKAVMLRQGVSMFFASALLALLPSVSHQVTKSAAGYGILLGTFGGGAVLGALLLQRLRLRLHLETIVSGGVVTVGATMIAIGLVRTLWTLSTLMLVSGGAWICFVSLISTLIQTLTADWVRARVLAMFLVVFQGSIAAGSAVWGALAQRTSVPSALQWAGLGTILSVALALMFRLPDNVDDMSPWVHWRTPSIMGDFPLRAHRPIMVMVEYSILPQRRSEFESLITQFGRVRRRDGASRWEVFRDMETEDRYVEVFLVESWAEHLRQHERQTRADERLQNEVQRCTNGQPIVHHLSLSSS